MSTEYLESKFNELARKIDSLVEVNNELIQQNIKLSNKLFGDVVTPEVEVSPSPSSLFYELKDSCVFISGPGTFDSKSKIKELGGEWQGPLKSWKCRISLEEVKQNFPQIKEKK